MPPVKSLSDVASWREWCRDDRGSAAMEFITVGMLLTVPLVYLVLTLSAIQSAVLAAEGAARHAARAIGQSATHAQGLASGSAAVEVALATVGLDASAASVEVQCLPNPAECITPAGTVTVSVVTQVPLPLVPPVLDLDVGLSVPIHAIAASPVSQFVVTP